MDRGQGGVNRFLVAKHHANQGVIKELRAPPSGRQGILFIPDHPHPPDMVDQLWMREAGKKGDVKLVGQQGCD
jgi:hypothetical protein